MKKILTEWRKYLAEQEEDAAPDRYGAIDIRTGHFGIQADLLDTLAEFLAKVESVGEITESCRSPGIISRRTWIH